MSANIASALHTAGPLDDRERVDDIGDEVGEEAAGGQRVHERGRTLERDADQEAPGLPEHHAHRGVGRVEAASRHLAADAGRPDPQDRVDGVEPGDVTEGDAAPERDREHLGPGDTPVGRPARHAPNDRDPLNGPGRRGVEPELWRTGRAAQPRIDVQADVLGDPCRRHRFRRRRADRARMAARAPSRRPATGGRRRTGRGGPAPLRSPANGRSRRPRPDGRSPPAGPPSRRRPTRSSRRPPATPMRPTTPRRRALPPEALIARPFPRVGSAHDCRIGTLDPPRKAVVAAAMTFACQGRDDGLHTSSAS